MTIRRPRTSTPRSPETPSPRSNVWRANRPVGNDSGEHAYCPHQRGCGACVSLRQNYETLLQSKYQTALKPLQELGVLTNTRVLPVQPSPKRLHYRTHAKLAVRATPSNTDAATREWVIGMFEPQTHTVVDTSACALHKESINHFLRDLKPLLAASTLQPYDEANASGDIRYLAIRAARHTDELLVTFVMTHTDAQDTLKNMLMALRRQNHRVVGAAININTARGNAIFGAETVTILGADYLRERVCELDFAIAPTTFFQVNPWQAEQIYRRIEQIAGSARHGQIAWDLYCGVGQITGLISRLGFKTFGIEENPDSVHLATHNMAQNQLQAEFISARTEDILHMLPLWAANPKLIVANPSRRGMQETVVTQLSAKIKDNAATFIYMSCAAETLGRDLKQMIDAGLKVRQLEAFDMFPYTDKLEWLAVVTP